MIDFTALNLPLKVLSESTTHAVESDRVDAAVNVSKRETQDSKVVPECIVIFLHSWIIMKPQHVNI